MSTPVFPKERDRWPVAPSSATTAPSFITGTQRTVGDVSVSSGRSAITWRGPTYARPVDSTSQFGIVRVVRGHRREMLSSVPVWVASVRMSSATVTMKAESVPVSSRRRTTASSSSDGRSTCRANPGPASANRSIALARSSASTADHIRYAADARTCSSAGWNSWPPSRSSTRSSSIGVRASRQRDPGARRRRKVAQVPGAPVGATRRGPLACPGRELRAPPVPRAIRTGTPGRRPPHRRRRSA